MCVHLNYQDSSVNIYWIQVTTEHWLCCHWYLTRSGDLTQSGVRDSSSAKKKAEKEKLTCLTLERGGIHLTCLEVRGRSLNGATDEGGQKDESEEDKIKEIKTESKVDQCPFANRLLLENTLWPEEP